jgi:hypothetical protein
MKENNNPIIVETLRILLGMVICLVLMLGVYFLIGKYQTKVLIGGIFGTLIAVGNFFFMAIGLSNIVQDSTEARIRVKTQASFMIRTLVMLALLVVAIKFLECDALATLLPLLFTRPVIMVEQFILKAREDKNGHSD